MNDHDMSRIAGLIAGAVVLTYCALTVILMFVVVPKSNESSFNSLVTALVGMVSAIIGYFYGRQHEATKTTALTAQALAVEVNKNNPDPSEKKTGA